MDEFPEEAEDEQTHTIATEFGAVEFSTVTCSSCEAEVPKDEAVPFFLGPVRRSLKTSYEYDVTFESREETAVGWACPYCREEGPAQYPQIDRVTNLVSALPGGEYLITRGGVDWYTIAVMLMSFIVVLISLGVSALIQAGVLS